MLVVNRDYLLKNADLVRDLLAAYFAARNHYQGTMVALIRNDARANNMELTEAQARKLVAGIRWKNLAENFAHFGLTREAHLQHIEDMITNITHVLMRSGAVTRDPTGGAANQLYYERVLANLQSNPPYPELARFADCRQAGKTTISALG